MLPITPKQINLENTKNSLAKFPHKMHKILQNSILKNAKPPHTAHRILQNRLRATIPSSNSNIERKEKNIKDPLVNPSPCYEPIFTPRFGNQENISCAPGYDIEKDISFGNSLSSNIFSPNNKPITKQTNPLLHKLLVNSKEALYIKFAKEIEAETKRYMNSLEYDNICNASKKILECYKKKSKVLDLSNLRLKFIPFEKQIIQCKWIETLDISNNDIKEISDSIIQLEHVPKIDISNNPPEIEKYITQIVEKELLVWHENIQKAWDSSGNNTLDPLIAQNIANTIAKNYNTQNPTLDLQSCNLSFLPECLKRFTWIQELLLSQNQFTQFPVQLLSLPKINYIDLSFNPLERIPSDIINLKTLKHFNLSHTKINKFPDSITSLRGIESLNLSNNNLTTIPDSIKNIENLKYLDISINKKLRKFPVSLLTKSINTVVFDKENLIHDILQSWRANKEQNNDIARQIEMFINSQYDTPDIRKALQDIATPFLADPKYPFYIHHPLANEFSATESVTDNMNLSPDLLMKNAKLIILNLVNLYKHGSIWIPEYIHNTLNILSKKYRILKQGILNKEDTPFTKDATVKKDTTFAEDIQKNNIPDLAINLLTDTYIKNALFREDVNAVLCQFYKDYEGILYQLHLNQMNPESPI